MKFTNLLFMMIFINLLINYLNLSTLRMGNGTLLDLVMRKNKLLTYAEAKPLIKELASCVNVGYCLILLFK